ncbi:hypothetical protein [Sulfurospirillum sp. UCH001]|uniref:hypothetical protein n=1 Tax=Sulfurospirillum sp. UCH001 TaxID=1581011 RepID=UPI000830BC69|nr:hypothetical protein [Sulfurospirillum sp. UCH001]
MIKIITQNGQIISEEELAKIEIENNKNSILIKIAELEIQQLRPLRELMIDSTNQFAKSKLESIDAQIAELRKQL